MREEVLRQAALNHKSDILKPFDAIIDLQGFDSIRAFCDYLGGRTVYIPKLDYVFKRCLELEAIREFNSNTTYQTLARKYEMCESHLRKITYAARKKA